MESYLTPFFTCFLSEDLRHLHFERIKVFKLGEIFFSNTKLVEEGLIELRLNASHRHELVVRGAISLIEVDARIE